MRQLQAIQPTKKNDRMNSLHLSFVSIIFQQSKLAVANYARQSSSMISLLCLEIRSSDLIKMFTIICKCNFCEAEGFYQSIAQIFTFIFFIKIRLLKGDMHFQPCLMFNHKARRIFIESAPLGPSQIWKYLTQVDRLPGNNSLSLALSLTHTHTQTHTHSRLSLLPISYLFKA